MTHRPAQPDHRPLRITIGYWAGLMVFGLFAGVQYNDPDGLLWAAVYGYLALLFGLYLAGQHYVRLHQVYYGLLFLAGMYSLSQVWFTQFLFVDLPAPRTGDDPLEVVYELGGVVIAGLANRWLRASVVVRE